LEIVQQHVDELQAQLGQRQKRGPGRPPKAATIDATSHIRTSGWPADPEERRAEMARRMKVAAEKKGANAKIAQHGSPNHPRHPDHPGHAKWAAKMKRSHRKAWAGLTEQQRQARIEKAVAGRGQKLKVVAA